jgi:hypothetical protein
MVLMPRRWHQVGEVSFANDGGKKARSPGRVRRKPLKPLRREGRIASAEPVCSCAHSFVHLAHETAGAARTRLSLRPLFRGTRFRHSPGASCRGIADVCLDRDVYLEQLVFGPMSLSDSDEAIHAFFLAARWIASHALAMTLMG